VENVNISAIKPNPFQVRQSIDLARIRELADEIRETGFWPGGLRARHVNGHYELVFGHRRLEALKLLGRKSVELEIVNLDDTAMASQSMVENLQREGLTEVEKANGIKRLIDRFGGPTNVKKVAALLGYPTATIDSFIRIAELDEETKQDAHTARMARSHIDEARSIAGADFVRVAAKQKLTSTTVKGIHGELAKLKPAPRKKIVEQLKTGKLTTADQVKRAARKITAASIKKSRIPPDLHDVLMDWVTDIKQWRKQLRAVERYREYIDTEPIVAELFRTEVAGLIDDLKRLL
jgi:ParB family chromosome partitioning protein